jgi:hypothetical protein
MDILNIIFFVALVALLAQIPIWIWAIIILILIIGVILS